MSLRSCDVLIVGGGPAGSTCAGALREAGADVVVLDRARFPRDKVCAGWITPAVLTSLRLTPEEYRSAGLTLQGLQGFRTACDTGRPVETRYADVVSYAVRRFEFDAFLLRRSGAHVIEGRPLESLRRDGSYWIANETVAAPLVVGAGGHFCPVARRIRPNIRKGLVVAREIEVRLAPSEACLVDPDTPELYFGRDLEGYGWCVRKGDYLNVGIGRRTAEGFNRHVEAFVSMLSASGKVPVSVLNQPWRGHAYLLAGAATRPPVADGLILVGDAAGLASPESGEGIGPAIESSLLAARIIVAARGLYGASNLLAYAETIRSAAPSPTISYLRSAVPAAVGRLLLSSPRFTRRVLTQWFVRPAAQGLLQSA
jgi:flavin-dependent dehydrogenase